MAPIPTQLIAPPTNRDIRRKYGVPTATKAPRPNSQARVRGEKKATPGDVCVRVTEYRNDSMMVGTRMKTRRARSVTVERSDAASKKTAGYTR